MLAFFLAVGIGAHALDELHGRPLRTRIGDRTLALLAAVSIGGAVALGIYATVAFTAWLAPLVAFGGFVVVAYNLELAGGRFHSDAWFALAWGAFPVLAGYMAQAETLRADAVVAAAAAALLSHAQRLLSTWVRTLRRRVDSVSGALVYRDGAREDLSRDTLTRAAEQALRALAAATVALAVALVLTHWA